MPTEDFLLDLDVDEIKKTLLECLSWRSEHGLLLAIMVMFEAFVVLASLNSGYSKASTEQLRKIDREAANVVKRLRDTIAHAIYEKRKIQDMARTVASRHAVERLYVKFFDRSIVVQCRDFECELVHVLCGSSGSIQYVEKIVSMIPSALRSNYSADDTEAALKFAYEQLTR